MSKRFGRHLKGKTIVCLGIPDEYDFTDPGLVRVLEARLKIAPRTCPSTSEICQRQYIRSFPRRADFVAKAS